MTVHETHLIKHVCVYSILAIEPKLCSMQYYFTYRRCWNLRAPTPWFCLSLFCIRWLSFSQSTLCIPTLACAFVCLSMSLFRDTPWSFPPSGTADKVAVPRGQSPHQLGSPFTCVSFVSLCRQMVRWVWTLCRPPTTWASPLPPHLKPCLLVPHW